MDRRNRRKWKEGIGGHGKKERENIQKEKLSNIKKSRRIMDNME